ncbi:unnamed protein product [Meloidogyne enterolobii]|uniref:Uncharacterized protein n=1 Tax=Meloidogyne enterolobii TaxID=390850 RepID=A0ACB0ZW66_MELEN
MTTQTFLQTKIFLVFLNYFSPTYILVATPNCQSFLLFYIYLFSCLVNIVFLKY